MPPAFSFRAKLPAYDAFFPLSYFYDKRYSFSQNAISLSKCLCATTIPCGQSRRSEGANCYPALLLDDATFASDAVSMNRRRILLDQLMAIRSLMGKEGTAGCDAAADDSRDVIKDLAKGMTLNKEQLTALSLLLL